MRCSSKTPRSETPGYLDTCRSITGSGGTQPSATDPSAAAMRPRLLTNLLRHDNAVSMALTINTSNDARQLRQDHNKKRGLTSYD
jgi:hypothetical protein